MRPIGDIEKDHQQKEEKHEMPRLKEPVFYVLPGIDFVENVEMCLNSDFRIRGQKPACTKEVRAQVALSPGWLVFWQCLWQVAGSLIFVLESDIPTKQIDPWSPVPSRRRKGCSTNYYKNAMMCHGNVLKTRAANRSPRKRKLPWQNRCACFTSLFFFGSCC